LTEVTIDTKTLKVETLDTLFEAKQLKKNFCLARLSHLTFIKRHKTT